MASIRDNDIKIELHERICEMLPWRITDVSDQIFPAQPHSGTNDYPSLAALMIHLLLHAAGAMTFQSLRLLHLHDIALLAARMGPRRLERFAESERSASADVVAWPPLRLSSVYFSAAIPADVLSVLERECPWPLSRISRSKILSDVSYSYPWVDAFPGIEWSHSMLEVAEYIRSRVRPSARHLAFRETTAATQAWASANDWQGMPQWRAHHALDRLEASAPGYPVFRQSDDGETAMTKSAITAARRPAAILRDVHADPFAERMPPAVQIRLRLLGALFQFQSNSRRLLRLVYSAYAGLPQHRLSGTAPHLTVRLQLGPADPRSACKEPAPVAMLAGAGYLGGATAASHFAVLSPAQSAALVVASRRDSKFAYHTRYELIEFAVFTLAARVQRLVPLHAACVGRAGRGILLVGSSGAGKSTVTLQCLLHGLEILSEDSVFVEPKNDARDPASPISCMSVRTPCAGSSTSATPSRFADRPVIRRRSGVEKFEVDLRKGSYRLARSALKIVAIVFLSPQAAAGRALLTPVPKTRALARLAAAQAYAANQPEWTAFGNAASKVRAFELRRGSHPAHAVDSLKALLGRDGQAA